MSLVPLTSRHIVAPRRSSAAACIGGPRSNDAGGGERGVVQGASLSGGGACAAVGWADSHAACELQDRVLRQGSAHAHAGPHAGGAGGGLEQVALWGLGAVGQRDDLRAAEHTRRELPLEGLRELVLAERLHQRRLQRHGGAGRVWRGGSTGFRWRSIEALPRGRCDVGAPDSILRSRDAGVAG